MNFSDQLYASQSRCEMPFGLARYWDSLESDEYEPPPCTSSSSTALVDYGELDDCQRQWLSDLAFSTEHECQTILYAKSVLCDDDSPLPTSLSSPAQMENMGLRPSKMEYSVGGVDMWAYWLRRPKSLSSSTGNLSNPPPKPQRRIARLKNNKNETISENSSVTSVGSALSVSTLDLIEACKFPENLEKSYKNGSTPQITGTTTTAKTTDQLNNNYWIPPGFQARHENQRNAINNSSSSHSICNNHNNATVINISGSSSSINKPPPPRYDQLDFRSSKVLRRAALRHTIAVNQEDVERARQQQNRHSEHDRPPPPPPPLSSSPKSMHSDSTLSVDSGQCSADAAVASLHSFSSSREEPHEPSLFHPYPCRTMPGYPRMASTMDHVLRTSSAIYSLLSSPVSSSSRDLISKAAVFVQIIENSPCVHNIPKQDLDAVRLHLGELRASSVSSSMNDSVTVSNYFTIIVRKLVEQVLQLFARIICKYLNECGSRDRLVVIALEHLIHVALFGDELSLEIIQCGGVSSVVKLIRCPATGTDTTRLLLRALAVLCGVAKGCLTLLTLGGLDVVLQQLNAASITCSIEAAGVLTQLTNPQHAFVKLNQVENVLIRLIDLIDECRSGESLLLVSAAIANVSLHDTKSVDVLYQRNAIAKMIHAYHRQECATIFVQEQIATILSRLAARRYEEALVAQGAVPVLLEMLTVTDTVHSEYCRRIRYKAAVCIGTLAATGIGLKALYNNQGYAILCHVLEMESSSANPLNMICTNIRNKLESTYQIESAV